MIKLLRNGQFGNMLEQKARLKKNVWRVPERNARLHAIVWQWSINKIQKSHRLFYLIIDKSYLSRLLFMIAQILNTNKNLQFINKLIIFSFCQIKWISHFRLYTISNPICIFLCIKYIHTYQVQYTKSRIFCFINIFHFRATLMVQIDCHLHIIWTLNISCLYSCYNMLVVISRIPIIT